MSGCVLNAAVVLSWSRAYLESNRPENLNIGSVKKQYYRELTSWGLIAFALGAVEGGVTGVLINHLFKDIVTDYWLSQAVGLAAGAPTMANLTSPLWARIEQGRDKVALVSIVGCGCALSLLIFALAPTSPMGLIQATAAVVLARIFWSGVVTIRANLWRANYPRYIRAKMTAKLVLTMAVIMAATGCLVGWAADQSLESVRLLYGVLGLLGMAGAIFYRGLVIRNADKLAVAEQQMRKTEGAFGLKTLYRILRQDRAYRQYMTVMFIFGSGNLMFLAPLILIINDQMSVSQWQQILITSSVPLATLPLTVGLWAKLLDKTRIVSYRAKHSWSFVVAIALFTLAVAFKQVWLLWVGGIFFGTAAAGGVLGWNLGHLDFARPEFATRYMAVHVTLTGIRGLIMPIIGVNLYLAIRAVAPDMARFSLFVPFAITLVGALLFVRLAQQIKREEAASTRS